MSGLVIRKKRELACLLPYSTLLMQLVLPLTSSQFRKEISPLPLKIWFMKERVDLGWSLGGGRKDIQNQILVSFLVKERR